MVIKAKAGDDKARERLIASSRPFIQQVTSWCSRRRLDWHADELSIALLAFNEAIDSYDPNRGAQFLSFARLAISGRLTDYRRRNKAAGKEVPLTLVGPDGSELLRPEVVTAAEEALLKEQARRERAEEIAVFTAELATYDLSLNDIEQACPRHRNRRQKLLGSRLCWQTPSSWPESVPRTTAAERAGPAYRPKPQGLGTGTAIYSGCEPYFVQSGVCPFGFLCNAGEGAMTSGPA